VIVLAAGSPGTDAEKIVEGLLAKEDPMGVVLAAQSLETALDLPLRVRERVESALAKLIPPKDVDSLRKLSFAGIAAAPLLVRALPSTRGAHRLLTLLALLGRDYEPAIPVIAECISDQSQAAVNVMGLMTATVGELAAIALYIQATRSDIAKRAFEDALEKLPRGIFIRDLKSRIILLIPRERGRELERILDDALKTSDVSQLSTPVGSTA
ncbi:MAG: hypothetical protein ACRD8O_06505, partial [Bryobacteraceae bacterium]